MLPSSFGGLLAGLLLAAGNLSAQWVDPRALPPGAVVVEPDIGSEPEVQPSFTIRVIAHRLSWYPALPPGQATSLFLIDPLGRRIGVDPATNASYSEIPAATYRAAEAIRSYTIGAVTTTLAPGDRAVSETIVIRPAIGGRYELQIMGRMADVHYRLVVEAPDRRGKPWTNLGTGSTEVGAVDRYELLYSTASTPPIEVSRVRDDSSLWLRLYGLRQGGVRQDLVSGLLLTDPRGRRLGFVPATGTEYKEIPRASYVEEGGDTPNKELGINEPADGSYTLEVAGTAKGLYSLSIYAYGKNAQSSGGDTLEDIPTTPGAVHRYTFDYSPAPGAPFRLSGAFDGGGRRSGEVNKFLTYADPTSARTPLPAGQTVFPLVIFYGPTIAPASFKPTLNGADVSRRFTPTADGHQLVRLKLVRGSNTLLLSVQETTATGQVATDTDRLVFSVR